jgi:hypothetical protein
LASARVEVFDAVEIHFDGVGRTVDGVVQNVAKRVAYRQVDLPEDSETRCAGVHDESGAKELALVVPVEDA